jgi:hypothetical protein
MASFACSTPGGSSLCFEGGSCAADGMSCDCPSDWQHDFSFFHDPNCALPGNGYLYNLIGCSVVVVWALLSLFAHARTTRKRVLVMVQLGIVNVMMLWFVALGAYLQNGWFEMAIVFHFVQLCVFCVSGYHVFIIIVVPVFAMVSTEMKQRAERFIAIFTGLGITAQGIPIIIMLATCRNTDHTIYNNCAVAFLYNLFVLMSIAYAIGWWATSHLLAVTSGMADLKSDKGRENRQQLLYKVKRMQRFIKSQACVTLTTGHIWPTVHVVLGSAPFHYIALWMSMSLTFITFSVQEMNAVVKRDEDTSSTSAGNTTTNKGAIVVAAGARSGPGEPGGKKTLSSAE